MDTTLHHLGTTWTTHGVTWVSLGCHLGADMIFVQNFAQPDFQAKSFTPRINSVNASNINNLGIFGYKWAN